MALAQTWMNDARLVLLDEPVAGVDFEYRQLVRDAVIERGSRSVVLMATHHHDDIAAACDHVLVLDGGRRCFVGPASDFLALGDGDVEAAIVAARRSAAP